MSRAAVCYTWVLSWHVKYWLCLLSSGILSTDDSTDILGFVTGEYVGYQFWQISRQKLLDILSGQDIREITEVVVYFHDNGTLAENTEYHAQRFQVFKLNRHHNSIHSLHQISEFGINNFTFYQKRVRYTKNNSGTDHTKHWLQNSQSSHLYLSIRLRGESDNIRFKSSEQNPAMLVTIEKRNPSQTTSRSGRSVNTDLSQIFSRNCEDTTGGGCCLEGRPTDLRQFLNSISDISDTPNERIVIRVCVGHCFPGLLNVLLKIPYLLILHIK